MKYASLWDRLVAQIRIEGDCWTWTGSVRRHGGGDRPAISMRVKDRMYPVQFNAARVICEIIHGPAPTPEHEASHLCDDNWLCICPDHVLWETPSENRIRQWAKKKRELAEVDFDTRGELSTSLEAPF